MERNCKEQNFQDREPINFKRIWDQIRSLASVFSAVTIKIDLYTFTTVKLFVDFMMFVEETRMFL